MPTEFYTSLSTRITELEGRLDDLESLCQMDDLTSVDEPLNLAPSVDTMVQLCIVPTVFSMSAEQAIFYENRGTMQEIIEHQRAQQNAALEELRSTLSRPGVWLVDAFDVKYTEGQQRYLLIAYPKLDAPSSFCVTDATSRLTDQGESSQINAG